MPEAQLLLGPLLLEFYHGVHLNCTTVVLGQGRWSLLLVLVLNDHVEVIQSALVLFLQILSHTGSNQLARGQLNPLVNAIRVENVPDLDGVIKQISYDVRACNFEFQYFVGPLDFLEVVIKVALEIQVERLVILGHYEDLKELVEDRGGKFILVGVPFLLYSLA